MDSLQSILSVIQQKQNSFPAAQKLVAAYVVKHYESIPFLSITTLADNIQVSERTIIKFCNSIGFEKFTEFKKAFADYAHSKLVISNKLSMVKQEGDLQNVFDITMQQDLDSIKTTMNLEENRSNLPKLIELLTNAKHIYVTGGRASGIMADMLANMLRYLNLKVHEIHPGSDYYDRLTMIEEEDVVIAFSFSRYTTQVVEGLQYLHQKSVPIALITDTELSPAFPYADMIFRCEAGSAGYFPTYAGCLSLIYAICSELGKNRSKEATEHAGALERLLIEKEVFK